MIPWIDVAMAAAPASGEGGDGSIFSLLFPFILMFAVFYFLLIRPQKKQSETHRKFLDSLEKGQEVVTSGGLIGKVVGVADNLVTIDVGEKIKIRVVKSHVTRTHQTGAPAQTAKVVNGS